MTRGLLKPIFIVLVAVLLIVSLVVVLLPTFPSRYPPPHRWLCPFPKPSGPPPYPLCSGEVSVSARGSLTYVDFGYGGVLLPGNQYQIVT